MFSSNLDHLFQPGIQRGMLQTYYSKYHFLGQAALQGLDQLAYLNLQTAKAGIAEAAVITRQMLATGHLPQLLSLANSRAQPGMEKAMAYGSQASCIVIGMQANVAKLVQEQFINSNNGSGAVLGMADVTLPEVDKDMDESWFVPILRQVNLKYGKLRQALQQAVGVWEGQLSALTQPVYANAWEAPVSDQEDGDKTAKEPFVWSLA